MAEISDKRTLTERLQDAIESLGDFPDHRDIKGAMTERAGVFLDGIDKLLREALEAALLPRPVEAGVPKVKAPDEEMVRFLDGVVGVVEASSFEALSIWREYHQELGKPWKDNAAGYLETIGHVDERPVCVSIHTVVIDGHKILFWHATSQVVDHLMIEEWLAATMPRSAYAGDRLNKTDAMNFHNVLPRALPTSPATGDEG